MCALLLPVPLLAVSVVGCKKGRLSAVLRCGGSSCRLFACESGSKALPGCQDDGPKPERGDHCGCPWEDKGCGVESNPGRPERNEGGKGLVPMHVTPSTSARSSTRGDTFQLQETGRWQEEEEET